MTYYDIWHMTYTSLYRALWVSKDPSQPADLMYELEY